MPLLLANANQEAIGAQQCSLSFMRMRYRTINDGNSLENQGAKSKLHWKKWGEDTPNK